MAMETILIVDDEPEVQSLVARALGNQGYECLTVGSGRGMWAVLDERRVDLVVLDLNLPGEDGFELARGLRSRFPQLGIIIASGRSSETDRVVGLELGADDYICKPFSLRELAARVKTVLRRMVPSQPSATLEDGWIGFGGLRFHPATGRLERAGGIPVNLTPTEYKLLQVFISHAGVSLSRAELQGHIGHAAERTIDVLVKRLRGKIEINPRLPQMIKTVRGDGYAFVAEITAA